MYEVEHLARVVQVAHLWGERGQRGIAQWEGTAVHVRVRQQPVVEQVQRTDAIGAALLQHDALEELDGAAFEEEVSAHGIAEDGHTTAMGEVVPEGITIDAVAGLREYACIGGSRVSGGLIRCLLLRFLCERSER